MSFLSQLSPPASTKKLGFGRPFLATLVATALFVVGVVGAISPPAQAANGEDSLRPGESLVFGQFLVSPNGEHRAGLDASGFLILSWRGDGTGKDALGGYERWKSSAGSGSSTGARLTMETDGRLVLRNAAGAMVSASLPQGAAGASLVIGDDGSLGLVNSNGSAGATIVAGVAAWAYPSHTTPPYRLVTERRLNPGQSLVSDNGEVRLTMRTTGNLVLTRTGSDAPIWETRTAGYSNAWAAMLPSGNFVVYSKEGLPIWISDTAGSGATNATLLNAGVLTLQTPTQTIWRSDASHPSTLDAGMSLTLGHKLVSPNGELELTMGGNGSLYLSSPENGRVWSSSTYTAGSSAQLRADGSLAVISPTGTVLWSTPAAGGSYNPRLVLQDDGNLVIYRSDGRTVIWSTGTGVAARTYPKVAEGSSRLNVGTRITPGQSLVSANGAWRVTMYMSGAFALQGWDDEIIWFAPSFIGGFGAMEPNGNFVMYEPSGKVRWSTATIGSGATYAEVQNTGVFVVGRPGALVWSSGAPANELWAGQTLDSLKSVTSPNGELHLRIWGEQLRITSPGSAPIWQSSTTFTAEGIDAYATLQNDGNLVVYSQAGKALWSSGTAGMGVAKAVLHDDGDLVLYKADGYTAVWRTYTANVTRNWPSLTTPGPKLDAGVRLMPGQYLENGKYRLTMQTDGHLVYTGPHPNPKLAQLVPNYVLSDVGYYEVWAEYSEFFSGPFIHCTNGTDIPGRWATMYNGNLVTFDPDGSLKWSHLQDEPSRIKWRGVTSLSLGSDGKICLNNKNNENVLCYNPYMALEPEVTFEKGSRGVAGPGFPKNGSANAIPGQTTSATVTITGTAQVGSKLTASVTNVVPSSGATLGYQWLRDGKDISGATAQAYTLVAADAGASIQVRVTVTASGYNLSFTTSSGVKPVGPTSASVSLSGCANSGCVLTASVTDVVPSSGATLAYQWYRDGQAIIGGTEQTYKLVATDVGSSIQVKVTVAASGWSPSIHQSLTMTVRAYTSGSVSLSGSATPGHTLTALVSNVVPSSGATLAYQWRRDGVAISGATNPTYTVAQTDLGSTIQVMVTVSASGWSTSGIVSSAPTVKAAVTGGSVSIQGAATPGSTLTAVVANVVPSSGATLTYRWYRDGQMIPDEKNPTYTVTEADLGATIKIWVSVIASGWSGSITTNSVVVKAQTSASVALTGCATPGCTLTGSVSNVVPVSDASLAYQWLRDGTAIPGATGQTYQLVTADGGSSIQVQVTVVARGWSPSTWQSSPMAVQAYTSATASIAGTAVPGYVLKVGVGNLVPASGATLTYQWRRDKVAIPGATEATYTIAETDLGSSITVLVTVTAPGFRTTSVVTAGVTVKTGRTQGSVSISGTTTLGSTLTATVTNVMPASTATLAYQWMRNGTAISGATEKTYVLTASDVGEIQARVLITAPGWTDSTAGSALVTVSATAKVTASIVLPNAPLTIATTLTASTTALTPATASLAYQWMRNGVAISGATSATYFVTEADLEARIQVRVTASAPGWNSFVTMSEIVTPSGFATAIIGTPTLGGTVSASVINIVEPTAALSYQWLRNGTAIPGADKQTYVLTTADIGELVVVVRGVAQDWDKTIGSPPLVLNGAAKVTVSISPGTTPVAPGVTLTASTNTPTPASATLEYLWMRNGIGIAGATTSTYILTQADAGARIQVRVTASAPGWTSYVTMSGGITM